MSAAKSVLLTGSSGFIAKHIALQLLEAGHAVRGSVRSMSRGKEVADAVRPHLSDPSAADNRLGFVELDLLSDDGWREALQDVDVLIHTASPFAAGGLKDENEVIAPAVDGTLRALRAAALAGVRRVIVTSSMAAIMESGPPPPGKIFDEDDWSDTQSPATGAYAKSKTLAERAAWNFVAGEAPEVALTVINPGLVVGPPLDIHFGTAFGLVRRVVRSQDRVVPNVGFSYVDVRDVAAMHVRAIDAPASIGRRIIGVSGFLWLPEIAGIVAAAFPDLGIVTRAASSSAFRDEARSNADLRPLLPLLDLRRELSNARAREILAIDFIPAADAIRATAGFLLHNGLV